jgi:hypothetical protein
MSLAFSGPGGSLEVRWIVYALLRDNVQHHLEGGKPSAAFSAVHETSEGKPPALDARPGGPNLPDSQTRRAGAALRARGHSCAQATSSGLG